MQEDVRLYSLSTCSHCNATKRLLNECEVHYDFTDVDLLSIEERNAILEDIRSFNPECSFPTVVIGKQVVVGFNEKEIRVALGLEKADRNIFKKILARIVGR